jgi:hypothetical protein
VSRLWLGTFPRNRGNSVEFPCTPKMTDRTQGMSQRSDRFCWHWIN